MSTALRLQIRGPSPYAIAPTHVEDAYQLIDQLSELGFSSIELVVAAPTRHAPMASGVAEWLEVAFSSTAGATLTGLVVTDLYNACKKWARDRFARSGQEGMRFSNGFIYGPDGEVLREWQATRRQDGAIDDGET